MPVTDERPQKVTPRHLRRQAYLYIRQSTLRQVVENTESTERQYALRQRPVALGWPIEHVVVIDRDLGHSGASAPDREGFQQLVRDVGLGRAGLVMGLEVSRLARNSTDWHRLSEICALTETLILDEDGLYDPAHFNDRLLLGLKGTMSEAELPLFRARLRGGIVNKARRGELEIPLPVGFVYDAAGRVTLDPDQRVQDTIRAFFETFRRTGSATAIVKAFRDQQFLFPRHARHGIHDTGTRWGPAATFARALGPS
jgi:DNA invertase Pin-like site-specific DNA recombinase